MGKVQRDTQFMSVHVSYQHSQHLPIFKKKLMWLHYKIDMLNTRVILFRVEKLVGFF